MGPHMCPELTHTQGSARMQAPPKTGKQSRGLCPWLIGRMRPRQKGRVSFNLGARSLAVTPGPDSVRAQPPPVGTGRGGRLSQPKGAHHSVGREHPQTPAAPQDGGGRQGKVTSSFAPGQGRACCLGEQVPVKAGGMTTSFLKALIPEAHSAHRGGGGGGGKVEVHVAPRKPKLGGSQTRDAPQLCELGPKARPSTVTV